jgi:hypothetical protein
VRLSYRANQIRDCALKKAFVARFESIKSADIEQAFYSELLDMHCMQVFCNRTWLTSL